MTTWGSNVPRGGNQQGMAIRGSVEVPHVLFPVPSLSPPQRLGPGHCWLPVQGQAAAIQSSTGCSSAVYLFLASFF